MAEPSATTFIGMDVSKETIANTPEAVWGLMTDRVH
jgi:hypothetical protein